MVTWVVLSSMHSLQLPNLMQLRSVATLLAVLLVAVQI